MIPRRRRIRGPRNKLCRRLAKKGLAQNRRASLHVLQHARVPKGVGAKGRSKLLKHSPCKRIDHRGLLALRRWTEW